MNYLSTSIQIWLNLKSEKLFADGWGRTYRHRDRLEVNTKSSVIDLYKLNKD